MDPGISAGRPPFTALTSIHPLFTKQAAAASADPESGLPLSRPSTSALLHSPDKSYGSLSHALIQDRSGPNSTSTSAASSNSSTPGNQAGPSGSGSNISASGAHQKPTLAVWMRSLGGLAALAVVWLIAIYLVTLRVPDMPRR